MSIKFTALLYCLDKIIMVVFNKLKTQRVCHTFRLVCDFVLCFSHSVVLGSAVCNVSLSYIRLHNFSGKGWNPRSFYL